VDVRQFAGPTLIICGRQDAVVGYHDAYESLNNYPMGTIIIADGAWHALGFTERKQLFKPALSQWLDGLEERTGK
jgi:hypothetical protein